MQDVRAARQLFYYIDPIRPTRTMSYYHESDRRYDLIAPTNLDA